MYRFIKLDYSIAVGWVADSYQLTCTGTPTTLFRSQPVYTRSMDIGQIEWVLDFTGFNYTPLLVHNSMIRKTRSTREGAMFYDGICQADGSNAFLQTLSHPDDMPNVYPVYYTGSVDYEAFVGEAGLIESYAQNKLLTCRFRILNQRKLNSYEIDNIWGDHDKIPVSHVFAFSETQTAEYNAFLSTFGDIATPYYSNRFAWQVQDTYLPEHMGFTRVAPDPLPVSMSKLYLGNDLVENMNVGNDPVIRAYFRNELVWQKEV